MERLADRFLQADRPEIVDLPTGSGKSDIVFVWAWARRQNVTLPRRLWMVSDRRVIVDQTYEAALLLAKDDVLISRLRGGLVRDEADILDPVVDQVISTTVDQFGSRLLFGAYGEAPQSWPIWRGLPEMTVLSCSMRLIFHLSRKRRSGSAGSSAQSFS